MAYRTGIKYTAPAWPGMACWYCFETFSRADNAIEKNFSSVNPSSGCYTDRNPII